MYMIAMQLLFCIYGYVGPGRCLAFPTGGGGRLGSGRLGGRRLVMLRDEPDVLLPTAPLLKGADGGTIYGQPLHCLADCSSVCGSISYDRPARRAAYGCAET